MRRARCHQCMRWRPLRKVRFSVYHLTPERRETVATCRLDCHTGPASLARSLLSKSLSPLWRGAVKRYVWRTMIGAPKWRGVYT